MSDSQDTGAAVAEPIVTTETAPKGKAQASTETRRLPPYNVVLLNDEVHTFEYVIEILMSLFAHGRTAAEALTWRVHKEGKAIVYTTHKEKAELKRDQVLSYWADPWASKPTGPLGCYIEPAQSD